MTNIKKKQSITEYMKNATSQKIASSQKRENVRQEELLSGKFISHAKGFGFVVVEGYEEDFFIPEEYTAGAFQGDTVQILPFGGHPDKKTGKRQEAKVVRILSRGITQLVGTYEQSKNHYGFVCPDNTKIPWDIYVPKERSKGAVTGHKVVVELTDYGSNRRSPEGKVVEILGHINDPGVDIMSIVRAYEIPTEFNDNVMNQVQQVPSEVRPEDMVERRDLRDVVMVTIDGEDAKDLDDAVSVSFTDGKYTLGVHIADVSHYVRENTFLDREAKKRGTSVYLVDRVIPMLPHALSNGICSLNAGVDRLALSCIMTVDEHGEIIDYEICESVIRVDKRLSYTQVKCVLEDETLLSMDEYSGFAPFYPMLLQMKTLSGLLRQRRRERGAIDFDFPEAKIILDKKGRPVDIHPYERNVATMIIEDFMLAANETIAQNYYWMESPFVYRVHEVPDTDKIQKLATFIYNLGYYMKSIGKAKVKSGTGEVHPKEIQKLLDKIAGTPEEALISRLTLRSMKQARYSVESSGHFGLASTFYTHFTSPIRRYPDLQIHRIIKEHIHGGMTEKRASHYKEILPDVAKHSSETERRAAEAERETEKLKKVQYMERHIGEDYVGVISGVTSWGIYVELPNTVEGMIRLSKLSGDFYYFNEASYEVIGEMTGRTFKLGMPLKVCVADADRTMKTIDFDLVSEYNLEEEES